MPKEKNGFFNEDGKEMRRPFLMAPVKYSRISSGYSGRRFHPVQKRWKAHLGTVMRHKRTQLCRQPMGL